MNLCHIITRSMEEVCATFKIATETSFREAVNTFFAKLDIQKMNRNGFIETDRVKNRLVKKHATMIRYYEKLFNGYFESYKPSLPLADGDKYREKIWVCWWQGLDKAPPIVKMCIESIINNSGSHEVIIITDDNYRDYVDIPEWVEDKRKRGIISRTHLSDILRLSLLSAYGGVWLDSTFFCCGSLDEYFTLPLWSIKRPDYLHCSIASGYFATYSLGCDEQHKWVFRIIRDLYLHYWEVVDRQIDYLTLDYMFVMAQNHFPEVKEAFASICPNNPRCDDLLKTINERFDDDVWNSLKEETKLFKLTWKQKFVEDKDGKTYYGHFLEGRNV